MPDNQESERYKQAAERETHLLNLKKEETVRRVFDAESAPKFKVSNEEVIRLLGGVVNFDADGVPVTNGVPLNSALENVAKVNPHLVASDWKEHHSPETQVKSRLDLPTTKDKVEFISKYGEMAFAKLAATPKETREVPVTELTWNMYLTLSLKERAKIAGEQGAAFIAGLKRKSGEGDRFQRLIGTPRNK
jgi:hypothetical protein